MKKILTLILVLALSLTAMVGCDKIPGLDKLDIKLPWAEEEPAPTPETPDTPAAPAVDADLKSAYDFVHNMVKDMAEKTNSNYTVPAIARVKDKTFQVKWEVSDERITLEASNDGLQVNVIVPEPAVDIPYTLKFTVTNEKGETLSREYSHVVPKFAYNTFAEYAAAEDDASLVICGVVTGVISKSTGSSANGLYIQDLNNEGGYYVYNLTDDPNGVILPGMTVKVKGNKDTYNGTYELINATVEIVDETLAPVTPVDFTDLLKNATALNDTALVGRQGMLVTVNDVTILEAGDNGYYYFKLGEHKVYLRISSSNNPCTSDDLANIKAIHGANYGNLANVTGVISIYSGNFYLSPVSADAFSNVRVPERSDAEKAQAALDAITGIPSSVNADTVLELPLGFANLSGVTVTWTVDNTDFSFTENGTKLPITLGSSAVTIKLTATAVCGNEQAAKEFTVEIAANLVMSETHAYSSYLNQVTAGKVLYLDGGVSGRYLTTTTDPSQAVAVYAEKAEGGYKLYILGEDGGKLYITMYKNAENKDSVNYDANGTTVYTYNKTVNAWVSNLGGTDKYLGCYNSFETVSVSNLSYINADNTGVSQFPLEILPVTPDTALNMSMNQVTAGKVVYLDGGVSGRYLTTTENQSAAVAVYAEKVVGGFKIYILDGETKMYVTIYNNAEGKLSVNYDAAGTSVFNYDASVNAWVANFGGTDYYIGSYNSFTTISASKLSYITPENTGVSQFVLVFCAPAAAPACEHANTTTSTVEATCTTDGSVTVTCTDCGATVSTTTTTALGHAWADATCVAPKTCGTCQATEGEALGHAWADATCVAPKTCGTCQATEGEALGHTYADGACTICGTPESHVCDFVAGQTVDPTCTTDGYTVYACNCGATEQRDAVPATGHTKLTETNPATCTASGSTVVTCEVCEETLSTTVLPQLDHSWDDGVYTNPTCTAAGFSTFTCVNCPATNKVTDENAPATGHADTNGDFKCDSECGAVVEPAADSVLTIEQALALGALKAHNTYTTNKFYVTGVITDVYNTQYGNMYITDASGKTFTVYGLYDATGTTRYDAMNYKPVKGDEITVYGAIGAYNSTPQMKNGWLDEVVAHQHDYSSSKVTDPTCTAAGYTTHTCSICAGSYTDTEVPALGHTTEEGTCERCGSVIGGDVVTVLPSDFVVPTTVANKADGDAWVKTNYPDWTITGKLGQTYSGGMIGFGRSGDSKSSLKSSKITTASAFTVTAVINGAGPSSGQVTSTLTFTLVDENGNLVATGYAEGASAAAIAPPVQKDGTYNISFTFEEGKTWTDVAYLLISFQKNTGNLGLKSVTFVQ